MFSLPLPPPPRFSPARTFPPATTHRPSNTSTPTTSPTLTTSPATTKLTRTWSTSVFPRFNLSSKTRPRITTKSIPTTRWSLPRSKLARFPTFSSSFSMSVTFNRRSCQQLGLTHTLQLPPDCNKSAAVRTKGPTLLEGERLIVSSSSNNNSSNSSNITTTSINSNTINNISNSIIIRLIWLYWVTLSVPQVFQV